MMYFICKKNQWQYFFLWKFSFNESQPFLKILGEAILMRPAVAFILGPGQMRAIAPVKLYIWSITLWLRRLQRFICHNKEPPSLKGNQVPRAFSTTEMGEKGNLHLPLLTSVPSQLSLVPYLQKGVASFRVNLSKHWFSDIYIYFFLSEDLLFPTWSDFSTIK